MTRASRQKKQPFKRQEKKMRGLFDIEKHLVFYRKYHFNNTNVAIHLVCIPLILLSAICVTIGTPISSKYSDLTVGVVIAWIYGLYYVTLDWQLGVPSLVVLISFTYFEKAHYGTLSDQTMVLPLEYKAVAVCLHVVCWLAQFYGHAVHEKRAPALFDNLLQAVVLAPFFVVYEVAFWLGYKLDVQKRMNDAASKEVLKMKAKENVAKRKAL